MNDNEVKVDKDASLHPTTVTDISKGKHLRKSTRRFSGRAGKVTSIKRHPGVWRKAMKLAKGDVKRLEIKAFDVVVVHNSPNWRVIRQSGGSNA